VSDIVHVVHSAAARVAVYTSDMQRLSEKMSPDEFLAWEREQPGKHHYVEGDIFDMSGGSARHNRLSVKIAVALDRGLENDQCVVLSADQKIGVKQDVFVYADAVVACAPLEFRTGTKDVLVTPVALVEVLSKRTEAYDRKDKLGWYLALPSLKHLMLVSQHEPRIELYTRQDVGSFRFEILGAGATMRLSHPDVAVAVDALYSGVFDLPGDE
jgi:Uma2 family endonuclease